MKRYFSILMLIPFPLMAQINLTPFVGLNSTKYTEAYSKYEKGGNYPIIGVEVEKTFKVTTYSPFNFSLVTGVSYLPNGFERATSFTALNSYSYSKTDIQTTYLQVPIVARINLRPFPLVENWRLYFGFGISINNLMKASIAEESIRSEFSLAYPTFPPPKITSYRNSQDVTEMGVKYAMFSRFELGMKFTHFQVSWRLSVASQDMYFKGYEKTWPGPALDSHYINAHNSRGITKEKYSEIIFGWRF